MSNHPDDRRTRLAWRGALVGVLLNVIGMPLDSLIGYGIEGMPRWPNLAAISVGVALFVVLMVRRRTATVRLGSWVFLINALAIVLALSITSGSFAVSGRPWTPFEANKLATMTVALLAPELWAGVLSIAAYAGAGLLRYVLFAPEIRAHLPLSEPWSTLGFGVFATILLIHRVRQLSIDREMVRVHTEARALEEVARALLAIRDLSNTPLQTIELDIATIEQLPSANLHTVVERIRRALVQLRESSARLASYEARLKWEAGDASFDPRKRLESRP